MISHHGFDERGFACAIVAEQSDNLAGKNGKIHIRERADFAECFRHIA
jgi:hypothetical protein